MVKVGTIKTKIAELEKEKGKVKRSYYSKHLLYGLSVPFFLVTGALSIVASPFAAVSWITIGSGLVNSYRKHLNARKAKLDGIDKEIRNLKGIKKINTSDAKKNERQSRISALKTEELNHSNAIKQGIKSRKVTKGLFVGTTIAGLIWPIPFAIAAPLVLAYKAKKDSDVIKHNNRIETIHKEVDYIQTEQKIADEAITIRAAQRQQQAAAQPTQQQGQQRQQQTQRRQAANTSPTKTRNEKIVEKYIELISKKPEELHNNKQMIKK